MAQAGPISGRTTRSTREDAASTTATHSHGTDTSQLVSCAMAAGVSLGRPVGASATMTVTVVATVADRATPSPRTARARVAAAGDRLMARRGVGGGT